MDESALKILLDNLEMSRSSLHGWLHFWTFLVVIGVALEVVFVVWEYTEDRHNFRRGIVRPPDKPSVLLLVLGLLGAGLVAVGVAGELYIDVQAGKVETEIRKANELRVSLLLKEAGDAEASAIDAAAASSDARQKADAVAKQADTLVIRLESASRKLGGIEEQVRVQGPRWKLLWDGREDFVKALKPFAGQKVVVVYCGQWASVPVEEFKLAQFIMNFLGKHPPGTQAGPPDKISRAEWETNSATWDTCSAGGASSAGGNLILTSEIADTTVQAAALALYDELNKLEISTVAFEMRTREADPNSIMARVFGPQSPYMLAAKDPSSVILLVGSNPMFDLAGWKKRRK